LTALLGEKGRKMSKKIKDPRLRMFIEFFNQQGVKFVDSETGEELKTKEDDETKNITYNANI
jgi:hypothetical protein